MVDKLIKETLEKCKDLELLLYSNFEEDELLNKKNTYFYDLPRAYTLLVNISNDFPLVLEKPDRIGSKMMDLMNLCFKLKTEIENTNKYVSIRHNVLPLKDMISGYELIAELYNDKLRDCLMNISLLESDYKNIFNDYWKCRKEREFERELEDCFKINKVWFEGLDEVESNFSYDNE